MRVGIGYDVHRFTEGKPLRVGGIEIPSLRGLEGHSDGDALLHAICDAILGAAGMEDIGFQFPVTDDEYRGIKSIKLLERVRDMVKKKGYRVHYVDCVVILEEPKIAPFKDAIKREIASALGVDISEVNIKATTQEGIGAIGRGEALAAYAVACLIALNPKNENSRA